MIKISKSNTILFRVCLRLPDVAALYQSLRKKSSRTFNVTILLRLQWRPCYFIEMKCVFCVFIDVVRPHQHTRCDLQKFPAVIAKNFNYFLISNEKINIV